MFIPELTGPPHTVRQKILDFSPSMLIHFVTRQAAMCPWPVSQPCSPVIQTHPIFDGRHPGQERLPCEIGRFRRHDGLGFGEGTRRRIGHSMTVSLDEAVWENFLLGL